MDVELTTMCCILDNDKNRVLMIDRKKSWKGMAFPGGYLEEGESIVDCVKREVWEETGLEIQNLIYKGNAFFSIQRQVKSTLYGTFCAKSIKARKRKVVVKVTCFGFL